MVNVYNQAYHRFLFAVILDYFYKVFDWWFDIIVFWLDLNSFDGFCFIAQGDKWSHHGKKYVYNFIIKLINILLWIKFIK